MAMTKKHNATAISRNSTKEEDPQSQNEHTKSIAIAMIVPSHSGIFRLKCISCGLGQHQFPHLHTGFVKCSSNLLQQV